MLGVDVNVSRVYYSFYYLLKSLGRMTLYSVAVVVDDVADDDDDGGLSDGGRLKHGQD